MRKTRFAVYGSSYKGFKVRNIDRIHRANIPSLPLPMSIPLQPRQVSWHLMGQSPVRRMALLVVNVELPSNAFAVDELGEDLGSTAQ